MRPLKILMAAGVLIAPLPLLAQTDAAPYGYQCSGVERGARGEAVTVSIAVDSAGKPYGTAQAFWDPPQANAPERGNLERPDITFQIAYVDTAVATIGKPLTATVTLSVFAPPRQRVAPAKLSARLNALSPSFRFDDGAFAPLGYLDVAPDDSLPGTATRAGTITLPQVMPRWLDVQAIDPKRRQTYSARFVLNDSASRDMLFAAAWDSAVAATADFKTCAPTLD